MNCSILALNSFAVLKATSDAIAAPGQFVLISPTQLKKNVRAGYIDVY